MDEDLKRLHALREEVAELERKLGIEGYREALTYLEEVNKRLLEMSVTDPLTGLKNRRYFSEKLSQLLVEAEIGHDLSLMMIDIDKFKSINDEFGHPAGDEILKKVGKLLTCELRKFDVLARYGGEEFVIALPKADMADAYCIANRMRRCLTRITDLPRPVTVSIGVSCYCEDARTELAILTRADRALYVAKNSGRDRVEVFSEASMHEVAMR